MTARLLYVCVRPQRGAADAEYESFRTAAGVSAEEMDALDLVRSPLPALDAYDGYLVGGSPFNMTDPESTKTDEQKHVEASLASLASAAAADDGPAALFTCYGIGIATRTLGGEVSRAYPEDTGPTVVTLTPEGERDPLFGGLATRFTALTAHKEGSAEPPPGTVLLATGEAAAVQAYRYGDRLYATQFHPEASTRAFTERMAIYRDDGYFASADYDVLAQRVLAASVTEPMRIVRAFAQRFAS
ncbi:glutamine amidotransferase-related protein [Microbacterium sp. ASV49]|uniref:GMP synthase n=1 Tax=Microbacterium candidum TaxID=3041922 RepID=A0ABT7MVR8_9MICO|nr:GMP synthase [Microbacterium sp. ASV49]MDL9978508.1 GMP synthase [Microbacterium sp. ASV49]